MADREGSIYYQSNHYFDFDRACNFLAKEGLTLLNKPENGNILALDDEGDDYVLSYEQAKQKALSGNLFNITIWLNYQWETIWTFRRENNYFIQDFYLGSLLHEQRNQVSKIFLKFNNI